MEFFSGKFGRIWANPSRPPKFACSYTYLMCCTTTDLGIFRYCSRDF